MQRHFCFLACSRTGKLPDYAQNFTEIRRVFKTEDAAEPTANSQCKVIRSVPVDPLPALHSGTQHADHAAVAPDH